MPVIRGGTSRGAHVRALWECLTFLIDEKGLDPSEKRVRLRTVRAALERAYPGELSVNEVQLMHWAAEQDGDAVQE